MNLFSTGKHQSRLEYLKQFSSYIFLLIKEISVMVNGHNLGKCFKLKNHNFEVSIYFHLPILNKFKCYIMMVIFKYECNIHTSIYMLIHNLFLHACF